MSEEKLRWCPRCQKQVSAMYGVCKDCGSFVSTRTHIGSVPILSACGVALSIGGPLAYYGACSGSDYVPAGVIFVVWPSIILGLIMFLWGFTVKKQ